MVYVLTALLYLTTSSSHISTSFFTLYKAELPLLSCPVSHGKREEPQRSTISCGYWPTLEFSLVTDPVCDFSSQDLKVQQVGK